MYQKKKNAETWAELPQQQWPAIALTSDFVIDGKQYVAKGSGFLIDTGKDTLAVTCKHWFLFFQGAHGLRNIDFDGKLESWEMYPKNQPEKRIVLGEPINTDPNEKVLSNEIMNYDWLLFKIKEKNPDIYPLKIRFGKVDKGEDLYSIGWTNDQDPILQPVRHWIMYKTFGFRHLIDIQGSKELAGLSGAPVIDGNGYVIGINGGGSGEKAWICTTEYLKTVLEKYGYLSVDM